MGGGGKYNTNISKKKWSQEIKSEVAFTNGIKLIWALYNKLATFLDFKKNYLLKNLFW